MSGGTRVLRERSFSDRANSGIDLEQHAPIY